MPLDNKCQIGPVAWPPSYAYVLVISIEAEAGFIASSRSHSSLPEIGKNTVDTAYDVGSVVGVLMDVGSLYLRRPVVFE
ncbi:hypothetical protein AVEN_42071-1 [Araneus ventricosus]|uniref:Uncharacterized protein n=1 Tax=Araneus ventricosus TaxID=182803 RepID=A0A4Y2W802_ARAVE|nr:hypothetical protein AVEN_42071-1 [Araneus ventricosus]